jgi:hypothetical protein
MSIRSHGQAYLRPPGLEPVTPDGPYADQEQGGTPAQMDETWVQDEDEEGVILTEEEDGEEYEDEEDFEEEDEQVLSSHRHHCSDTAVLRRWVLG